MVFMASADNFEKAAARPAYQSPLDVYVYTIDIVTTLKKIVFFSDFAAA